MASSLVEDSESKRDRQLLSAIQDSSGIEFAKLAASQHGDYRQASLQWLKNLAVCHWQLGQGDEAAVCYERALGQSPLDAHTHNGFAYSELSSCHPKNGWAESEWRFQEIGLKGTYQQGMRDRLTMIPWWDGVKDLRNKRLLLLAEQGLGDVLIGLAFLPELAKTGARIELAMCHNWHSLHQICSALPEIDRVYLDWPSLEQQAISADYLCPLLSLPIRLSSYQPRGEASPFPPPYPLSQIIAKCKSTGLSQPVTLPPRSGQRRIGFAISSGKHYQQASARNLPSAYYEEFFSLLGEGGGDFLCLQPDVPPDLLALRASHPKWQERIILSPSPIRDFLDTAELAGQCDGIISVTTSLASFIPCLNQRHNPKSPYDYKLALPLIVLADRGWRWGGPTRTSPWFPDAKIIPIETGLSRLPDWEAALSELKLLAKQVWP